MEKKQVLEKYLKSIADMLNDWVTHATDLRTTISTATNILPFDFHSLLRQINRQLEIFSSQLQDLQADYIDLENTYGLNLLSLAYLTGFSGLVLDIEKALNLVNDVANKYSRILEIAKIYEVDVDVYVTHKNQKAIERIQTLDTDELIAMLSDTGLLDF
jgi:hypothetical protein